MAVYSPPVWIGVFWVHIEAVFVNEAFHFLYSQERRWFSASLEAILLAKACMWFKLTGSHHVSFRKTVITLCLCMISALFPDDRFTLLYCVAW